MRARILLVDADKTLIESVSGLLAAERFEVEVAADGDTGFARASSGDFDLVILGTTPAQRSGFSVCAELHKTGVDASILLLSSKTLAEKRVTGLRLGADDCVPRSCDPSELIARVEALLRRVPKASRGPLRSLRFGDVLIDFELADARKGDCPLSLSSRELRLLQYLGPIGTRSSRDRSYCSTFGNTTRRFRRGPSTYTLDGSAKNWRTTRNGPNISRLFAAAGTGSIGTIHTYFGR